MTVLCPEVAAQSGAGQFVNVYLDKGEHLLPRPISICEINKKKGTIRLVYRVCGKGTAYMSKYKKGDKIKLLAPLGNCFEIGATQRRIAVVGGGIGTPPLLELVKQIRLVNPACEVHVFLGFKTRPILVKDFESCGVIVHIATDDGSVGFHGYIGTKLNNVAMEYELMYACGPHAMLKAVAAWAKGHDTKLFVSLEERMACGIGACVGCVTKVKTDGGFAYEKVCKSGSVFPAEEVCFE